LCGWLRRIYDPVIVSRVLEYAMPETPCRGGAIPLLIAVPPVAVPPVAVPPVAVPPVAVPPRSSACAR
jgi:hypothetical protein